jgi:hypothetical protein
MRDAGKKLETSLKFPARNPDSKSVFNIISAPCWIACKGLLVVAGKSDRTLPLTPPFSRPIIPSPFPAPALSTGAGGVTPPPLSYKQSSSVTEKSRFISQGSSLPKGSEAQVWQGFRGFCCQSEGCEGVLSHQSVRLEVKAFSSGVTGFKKVV